MVEDSREEFHKAIEGLHSFHKKQMTNDQKRLNLSGGIYCVVPGCVGKRTGSGKRKAYVDRFTGYPSSWGGYYRLCEAHRQGKGWKKKIKEDSWRAWDREDEARIKREIEKSL